MRRIWLTAIILVGLSGFVDAASSGVTQYESFEIQKQTATTNCDEITTYIVTREKGMPVTTTTIQPFCPTAYLEKVKDRLPPMNQMVVDTLLSYPRNGRHKYWWPRKGESNYDGCTTHVVYRGEQVLEGEPQGRTFCCGLTLEVFYRVLNAQPETPPAWSSLGAKTVRKLWFCQEIFSPGPDEAMTALGVGRRITDPDDALPGDFVQIWRNNRSGHSVIFIAWAFDPTGKRLGMHYWSTQQGEGISFASEIFGDIGPTMSMERTVLTRLLPPSEWKSNLQK